MPEEAKRETWKEQTPSLLEKASADRIIRSIMLRAMQQIRRMRGRRTSTAAYRTSAEPGLTDYV